MKIVYFIDHLRPDGAQFVLQQLVEGLAGRGHRQAVICLNDSWDEILVRKIRETGTCVEIIGKPALFSGYGIYRIWRRLKRDQYNVAVTILFASDVIGKITARASGIPRIVSNIQTRDEFYAPWQRWLVRMTMPLTDLVVLPSNHFWNFATREEGAPQQKMVTIYNFVSVENYRNPVSWDEFRNDLGLSSNKFLIGCAGRLTYQKGFDIFLKSLAMIEAKDFHVFIAGVGEEEARLKALAHRLGIAHRVYWAGYRRDLPRILGALDLYIQPSRYEGMPLAVLEAMASGCPIVASAVDGNQELIEDGVSGWLVPPEDSNSLAKAIEMAMRDSMECKKRGRAAQERVSSLFGSAAILAEWEQALSGTLGNNVKSGYE